MLSAEGFSHVVLPATALGLILVGPIARMTRTALPGALGSDHLRTARAKGAGPVRVVMGHARSCRS